MQQLFLIDMQDETKWEYKKITTPAILGRSDHVDVCISGASVSSKHAKIDYQDSEFVLTDLGATNGTRINGERIQEAPIHDGDLVAFGMENYLVRIAMKSLPCLYRAEEDKAYAIGIIPFYIGRHTNNQLILKESSVSNVHAIIDTEGERYIIRDNDSTNGIRVNSKRVRTAELKDGDEVTIGRWKSVFLQPEQEEVSYSLRFLNSDRKDEIVEIHHSLTIGRSDANDLILQDASISNQHSKIYWAHGHYWIKDCESKNGTKVNGVLIQTAKLKHGSEITIGRHSFVFFNPRENTNLFYLFCASGEQGGTEFPLNKDNISIGSSNSCDISIHTKGISKLHARIYQEKDKFFLQDCNSTNGTFVNDKKINRIALNHGDTIILGLQKFIFCNSMLERPLSLQEEHFLLLPKGKNNEPYELEDSCRIGYSKDNDIVLKHPKILDHHALIKREELGYTIQSLSEFANIYLNEELITKGSLEHGDEIRIENYHFIFKSTLRPLASEEEILPKWFMIAASALVALLLLTATIILLTTSSSIESEAQKVYTVEEIKKDEQTYQSFLIEYESKKFSHCYAYICTELWNKYSDKIIMPSTRTKIKEDINNVKMPRSVVQNLIEHINRSQDPIEINIAQEFDTFLINNLCTETKLVYRKQTEQTEISWDKLKKAAFYDLIDNSGFSNTEPYKCAELAKFDNNKKWGCKCCVEAWKQSRYDHEKAKIGVLYASLLNIDVPSGGFILYNDQLVTPQQKAELEAKLAKKEEEKRREEEERLAEQRRKELLAQREQEEFERQQREIAKQAIKEQAEAEFEKRFAILDEYARTFSFRLAIEQFEKFKKDLFKKESIERVTARINELKDIKKLFDKLLDRINNHALKNNEYKFTEKLIGKLTKANEEQFTVEVTSGEVRERWEYLTANKMYHFFRRIELTPAELFLLAKFCFNSDMEQEGQSCLIAYLDKNGSNPTKQKNVNELLAKFWKISIPEGGFVPYHGKFVTAEEKDNLSKGLVKWNDQWITRAEKKQLEKGLTKQDNKWSYDEKKLIARGFLKYKDKWYSAKDLEKIRQNWDDAWTLNSEHYDLRTNISSKFMVEMKNFMEAAYPEYEKFFKKPIHQRIEIYAFRTFEDYKNYCINEGYNKQIKAGGFAESKNYRGVGYKRIQNDSKEAFDELWRTLIHEGTHVYHFLVAPKLQDAPSWYMESISTQFEGHYWDGKTLKVDHISKSRYNWIKTKLQSKEHMAWNDLFNSNSTTLINTNSFNAMTFYSEAWSIYYYFMHTPNIKIKRKFEQFVLDMNDGLCKNPNTAFTDTFGDLIIQLENDWKNYILKTKLKPVSNE